jgi:glycosyltransferase involved in cell wall biosynthesis
VLTPTLRSTAQAPTGRLAIVARRAAIAIRLARAWARILYEARRGRYDVVVVNCDTELAPATAGVYLLTKLPGMPPVVQIGHNVREFNRWGGEEMFAGSALVRAIQRQVVRRYALVLLHGEQSRSEFASCWPEARTAIIPHGDERIFGDEPPPPSPEERILFFGDWRKVKGLPILMDAFDELSARRPNVRLTIAGKPARQDIDPDLIRRWAAGHGENVKVVDRYVPIEDVPSVFSEARVVVTPYFVGYQSGVVHLAMTMGRAVVSADVGDLGSSVIEGETGLLVPPNDAGALAAALERVVSDPKLASRFGAEGRRRVLESSGWEAVAERVEQALRSLNGSSPH